MRKFVEPDVADNPLYHDTWKLLKKYRDVVWSLELSVQHVRTKFEIEYGTSIEDFLDSVYLAGADLARHTPPLGTPGCGALVSARAAQQGERDFGARGHSRGVASRAARSWAGRQ